MKSFSLLHAGNSRKMLAAKRLFFFSCWPPVEEPNYPAKQSQPSESSVFSLLVCRLQLNCWVLAFLSWGAFVAPNTWLEKKKKKVVPEGTASAWLGRLYPR